jgi:hypothetical protein
MTDRRTTSKSTGTKDHYKKILIETIVARLRKKISATDFNSLIMISCGVRRENDICSS